MEHLLLIVSLLITAGWLLVIAIAEYQQRKYLRDAATQAGGAEKVHSTVILISNMVWLSKVVPATIAVITSWLICGGVYLFNSMV